MTKTYFEDVVVDRVQETPAITVTEAHVAMYLGVTREAELAPGTVPEILPLCLSVGLGWRTRESPMVVLAFVGLEWQIVREMGVAWLTTIPAAAFVAIVVLLIWRAL